MCEGVSCAVERAEASVATTKRRENDDEARKARESEQVLTEFQRLLSSVQDLSTRARLIIN